MKMITIDIETASDENINVCGVYRYAVHGMRMEST